MVSRDPRAIAYFLRLEPDKLVRRTAAHLHMGRSLVRRAPSPQQSDFSSTCKSTTLVVSYEAASSSVMKQGYVTAQRRCDHEPTKVQIAHNAFPATINVAKAITYAVRQYPSKKKRLKFRGTLLFFFDLERKALSLTPENDIFYFDPVAMMILEER